MGARRQAELLAADIADLQVGLRIARVQVDLLFGDPRIHRIHQVGERRDPLVHRDDDVIVAGAADHLGRQRLAHVGEGHVGVLDVDAGRLGEGGEPPLVGRELRGHHAENLHLLAGIGLAGLDVGQRRGQPLRRRAPTQKRCAAERCRAQPEAAPVDRHHALPPEAVLPTAFAFVCNETSRGFCKRKALWLSEPRLPRETQSFSS